MSDYEQNVRRSGAIEHLEGDNEIHTILLITKFQHQVVSNFGMLLNVKMDLQQAVMHMLN